MYSDQGMLTAADMLTRDVVTLRADTRTLEAVQLLLDHRISGAPVVDEEGLLIGVFTEKDCIHAMTHAIDDHLPSSLVGDHMSTVLITIFEETSLLTIAHLFLGSPVRRLPVVRTDGRLVGIVSRSDLLKLASDVMRTAPSRDRGLEILSQTDGEEDEDAPDESTGDGLGA